MIIRQGGASLYPWMVNRLDYLLPEFVTEHSFGVMNGEVLVAACSFHQRGNKHWEATIVSDTPRWCTKEVLRFLLNYPFETLGARRLTAQCLAGNKAASRFLERVGFTYEGCLRQYFNGEDVLIYSILRDEYGRYRR